MSHPRVPMQRSLQRTALTLAAIAVSMAVATQAGAAENGLQRYSPGVGGSDMTAPLVPGWYIQAPLVAYHANKIKGNDGKQATSATPVGAQTLPGPVTVPAQPGMRSNIGIDADTYALLPRITYLSPRRVLGAKLPKRHILSTIYALRSVAIVVFLAVPLTPWSVYVFAAVMGFLWLSTVPPTNAVVAQIFGAQHLSMLGGFVFLSHQVGSFLGGKVGEQAFGHGRDRARRIAGDVGPAQGALDDPVFEGAQVGGVLAVATHPITHDFAHWGGIGRDVGLGAWRQIHAEQSFVDLLPCQIDIGVVVVSDDGI